MDVWVVSSYMAHDHGNSPPHDLLKLLVAEANNSQTPVIIGADANAHHHMWGSTDVNERGLVEYIHSRGGGKVRCKAHLLFLTYEFVKAFGQDDHEEDIERTQLGRQAIKAILKQKQQQQHHIYSQRIQPSLKP